jgi:hypothetical protein
MHINLEHFSPETREKIVCSVLRFGERSFESTVEHGSRRRLVVQQAICTVAADIFDFSKSAKRIVRILSNSSDIVLNVQNFFRMKV